MKKYLFFALAVVSLASCTTITKTARTESVPYSMYNATVADLEVAPARITYTLQPSKAIERAGLANCKKAAIQEALTANGNADLLLEPEFVVNTKRVFFKTKVTSVTVSGRPAKYTNFRSMDDKVWTDPVFRESKGTSFHVFQAKEECAKTCKK